MPKPTLTTQDYNEAAKKLDCEVSAIKSVAEVESSGDGFLPSGEPKILFERHIFSARTNHLFDKTHPGISNKIPGGYGTYASQHKRLQEAAALNRDAALMSASWGKFQIMGFNYPLAGFNTLQEFVTAMYTSEKEQLNAFVNYLKSVLLDDELREHRWADFARRYNGPQYSKNKYDTKLSAAYKMFISQGFKEIKPLKKVRTISKRKKAVNQPKKNH